MFFKAIKTIYVIIMHLKCIMHSLYSFYICIGISMNDNDLSDQEKDCGDSFTCLLGDYYYFLFEALGRRDVKNKPDTSFTLTDDDFAEGEE